MHLNAHLDFDLIALETDDTVTVMLELEAPQAPHDTSDAAARARPTPRLSYSTVPDRWAAKGSIRPGGHWSIW